jgi:hypothetical protein
VHDRLTIARPANLGASLAAAIRTAVERPLTITRTHVPLLDARLAAGDFESVRTLLRTAVVSPALPLFVARYVRWSGDLNTATAVWPDVMTALDAALADDAPGDAWLSAATAAELGATATDLGDATLAARLHRTAQQATASIPGRAPKPADGDVERILDVAVGVLGLDPDAARGRLRLRPALDRFDVLEARNIRFGDGTVSLQALRNGAQTSIRVAQDAGGIPITVLLEPFLPGPGSSAVDGRPADLEARTAERRTLVSVQLVLDEERELLVRSDSGG